MSETPHTIGIILDGNRRWAKEKGLSSLEGHRAGLEKIRELADWVRDAQIKEAILYVFSTENWNRSKEEVSHLLGLIEFAFDTWIEEIIQKDVRIRFIGQRERFSEKLQKRMQELEEKTQNAAGGTLAFALSYGGRAEILAAVNRAVEKGASVSEDEFRGLLWSADLADPDLIIRPGGQMRLSNFLTWQSAYSELFFTDTHWPALTREEFFGILAEFAKRERRRGR